MAAWLIQPLAWASWPGVTGSSVRSTLAELRLTNRTELAAWALRDPGS